MICDLIKLTDSVKVELIPWKTTYLPEKTYSWECNEMDSETLSFNFFFDKPPFISTDERPDTLMFTFTNTHLYMVPNDDSKEPIPDGWKVSLKLPPQMSLEETGLAISAEDAESGIVTLIASNSWISFIFGVSMQPLFDMINSLQITALLPLNNIMIPATAMDLFKILVMIVAFDFFDMYEYVDPGFTPTDPYSDKFDWFGFGSCNYVEGLGTVILLLCFYLIF